MENEKAAQEWIDLRIYPELTSEQAQYMVYCIKEFLAH